MKALRVLTTILGLVFLSGCTEPYALQTRNYESAIAIEATITNELKQHAIKISRTYRFEDEGPTFESGANVYVQDDLGTTFNFVQQDTMYVSSDAFQAQSGRAYQLHVTTQDGNTYESSTEAFTVSPSQVQVTAQRLSYNGVDGAQISVSSQDSQNTTGYYRFEYEETFKVIPPFVSDRYVKFDEDSRSFYFVDRNQVTGICYSTRRNDKIDLFSTKDLSQDAVENHLVRFIPFNDWIIRDRYSIKVRQYVTSLQAYTFYKTLSELSQTGNILSQLQPGFFYGNIRNNQNPNAKVIGFFDVSSVSEHRIFFNYNDLFPNMPRPDYGYECNLVTYDSSLYGPGGGGFEELRDVVRYNLMVFYLWDDPFYTMVKPECGDCTSISSNVIPPFWQD